MYAVPSRVRRRRKRPILPSAAAAASAALAEEREACGNEEEGREEAGQGTAAGRFHPCDLCGCLPSKHVSTVRRSNTMYSDMDGRQRKAQLHFKVSIGSLQE